MKKRRMDLQLSTRVPACQVMPLPVHQKSPQRSAENRSEMEKDKVQHGETVLENFSMLCKSWPDFLEVCSVSLQRR